MDYLAGASGAALGFIAGDVPGAVLGAKMGYNASKFFTEKDSMAKKIGGGTKRPAKGDPFFKTTKKVKSKGKTLAMVQKRLGKYKSKVGKDKGGTYRGRFKKPQKLVNDIKAKATRVGWTNVLEWSGQVSDSDCVYLHYNNYNVAEIARAITGSCVRALFREAKIQIVSDEQELPLAGPQNSATPNNAWHISFVVRDAAQLMGVHTFAIPENATLRSVILLAQTTANHLGDYIYKYLRNEQYHIPVSLQLNRGPPGGVDASGFIVANILLESLMVELEMNATLTVQNSTLGVGASATDGNADRVDNQPVKGSLFHFKNADPRLRSATTSNTGTIYNYDVAFSAGCANGVNVFGSGIIPYTVDDEPPNARIWKNVKKSSGVILDPGNIKKTSVSNKYKKYFVELLKKLRADAVGLYLGLPFFQTVQGGQSQMLVLEERIRTPSTNLITCNWEYELRNYAIAKVKPKQGYCRGNFTSLALGQWVPTS